MEIMSTKLNYFLNNSNYLHISSDNLTYTAEIGMAIFAI